MKKILGILVAVLLLAGFAGQGMATMFTRGDLIRVIYDTSYDAKGNPTGGSYEYVTDLGKLTTLEGDASGTEIGDQFSQFCPGAYSNLQVAYFVAGITTFDIAAPGTTAPAAGTAFSTTTGGMSTMAALDKQTNIRQETAKVGQSTTGSY